MQEIDDGLAEAGVKAGDLGLSESMMGMSGHMSDLEHASAFDAMFMRMMIPHHQGAIRMAVKQVKRERMRNERERLAVASEGPAPLPDPDLAAGVAQLSPMQRAVVVLFYWEDHSVFDIARTLEVSESTVKQHLFRARSRLAALLGEAVADDVR